MGHAFASDPMGVSGDLRWLGCYAYNFENIMLQLGGIGQLDKSNADKQCTIEPSAGFFFKMSQEQQGLPLHFSSMKLPDYCCARKHTVSLLA